MSRFNHFLIKNICMHKNVIIEGSTGRSASYVISMDAKNIWLIYFIESKL